MGYIDLAMLQEHAESFAAPGPARHGLRPQGRPKIFAVFSEVRCWRPAQCRFPSNGSLLITNRKGRWQRQRRKGSKDSSAGQRGAGPAARRAEPLLAHRLL